MLDNKFPDLVSDQQQQILHPPFDLVDFEPCLS